MWVVNGVVILKALSSVWNLLVRPEGLRLKQIRYYVLGV